MVVAVAVFKLERCVSFRRGGRGGGGWGSAMESSGDGETVGFCCWVFVLLWEILRRKRDLVGRVWVQV